MNASKVLCKNNAYSKCFYPNENVISLFSFSDSFNKNDLKDWKNYDR